MFLQPFISRRKIIREIHFPFQPRHGGNKKRRSFEAQALADLPAIRWQHDSENKSVGCFDFFPCAFPASDSRREMFHVFIAKLFSSGGGFFICSAFWTAAIRDDERVFIFGQNTREIVFMRIEINGGRDVAFL